MIVLVGFMGAGKSTVGGLLAESLGGRFVDSDEAVQQRLGHTVREHFDQHGEASFRAVEQECIADLLAGDARVLALGGGSLGSSSTREALAGHDVVLLETSLDEVRRRVGDDPARPMLRSHDVAALYAARAAGYADAATVVVRTDGRTPRAVADDVLAALDLAAPAPEAS